MLSNKKVMMKKIATAVFVFGSILLLISSVLVMEHVHWGKYTFAAGTAIYIIQRLRDNYSGDDFRLKRLNRFNLINSLLLVVISYMQFHGKTSWVVLLLIVAVLEMYSSFRITAYEKSKLEAETKEDSEVE
jgi:hypothetical protein